MIKEESEWVEEYLLMIEDCLKRSHKMTDWEQGFIDSISNRLKGLTPLTAMQLATLDEIWEKVTKDG